MESKGYSATPYPNAPPSHYQPQQHQQHQPGGVGPIGFQNDNYSHPQPPPTYGQAIGGGHGGGGGIPMHVHQPLNAHQPPPIINQPQIVQHVYTPLVGPDPSSMQCPSCRQHIITRIDFETSTKTHLMAALLCAFVCWPCAWMPYVMNSCKNANHYCPNCGSFIGAYKS